MILLPARPCILHCEIVMCEWEILALSRLLYSTPAGCQPSNVKTQQVFWPYWQLSWASLGAFSSFFFLAIVQAFFRVSQDWMFFFFAIGKLVTRQENSITHFFCTLWLKYIRVKQVTLLHVLFWATSCLQVTLGSGVKRCHWIQWKSVERWSAWSCKSRFKLLSSAQGLSF